MSDPLFDDVSVLLRMNGVEDGVVFTDSSNNAHSVTVNGVISTTEDQIKFGSASCDLTDISGANNLMIADHASFGMGTDDWTVEGWFYENGGTPASSLPVAWMIGNINGLYSISGAVDADTVYVRADTTVTNSASGLTLTGGWHHIAWVRSGSGSNNIKIYVDGVQVLQATYTCDLQSSKQFWISYIGPTFRFAGYIDEFRVTKGIARYTTNFTPPTEAFPGAGSTIMHGADAIGSVYHGSTPITAVYKGATQIWP